MQHFLRFSGVERFAVHFYLAARQLKPLSICVQSQLQSVIRSTVASESEVQYRIFRERYHRAEAVVRAVVGNSGDKSAARYCADVFHLSEQVQCCPQYVRSLFGEDTSGEISVSFPEFCWRRGYYLCVCLNDLIFFAKSPDDAHET